MAPRAQEPESLPRRSSLANPRPLRHRLQHDDHVEAQAEMAARHRGGGDRPSAGREHAAASHGDASDSAGLEPTVRPSSADDATGSCPVTFTTASAA